MTLQVEYLVVAGGGGGGAGGGGGGGGGVLTGTSSLNPLTNYTVTVGTGGAGGPLNSPSGAAKGGNSVFSDQTALGGGSGGGPNTGGSGGGGGYGYGLTGGAGTAGQGNNGGNGIASGNYGGGGGGGAGGAGQNAPSLGGTGGLGFTSSISGSAVDYGGGGGGGQSGIGSGGGGNGGFGDSTQGTEGAINRGGGGGGGGNGGTYAVGRNGGSGVVILKYANNVTISNPGGGLTYTTSTAVSGYNITTFTGGTGTVQFEVLPENTLATRFFPDVYFNLVNDYAGTKKYIDGANGSNSNNGDTVSTAYATIDYAITSNTSATSTMFIIMEGTYTMTAVSTGDSVTIRDDGNERVFVCCPGRTIVQWTASTADRDAPMVRISNANSAIYGGIFRRNNNGRTTNYTVAYWKGQTRGNYYNCVFSETNANNAWSYQYDNYGQNNLALRNCTFFNGAAPSGNYTNAGTCLTIDSVFNTTVSTGGTETNVFKSQTVNSTTYETTGVTTAGVYSGTYSWSAPRTLPAAPPAPTLSIPVEAFLWGGGGGGGTAGGWSFGAPGGAGGAAEGVLTANLNENLYITVGGGGQVNSTTSATGGGGIANRSGSDNRYGSGGGGFSGIFTTLNPSSNGSVIISGGGGGGGSSRAGTGNAGGAGGGSVGEDGASPYDGKTAYRGRGGTQSAAGADASCDSANASGFQGAFQGGTSRLNGYGGAGGGGFWGGSAGGYSESNTMAGGGGGSGYYNTTLVSNATLYSGTGTTPGNNSNSYRGTAGNAGAVASAGSPGKVVLRYPSATGTASGGTITTEGIYTVHTFTENGTFTILTVSPGLFAPSTVSRGSSFQVLLVTENVSDNTTITYTITGVTSGDLNGDPLTGNFTIVDNQGTITIPTADIPLNRTLTISANGSTAQVQLLGSRKISAQYLLAAGGGGGGTDMGGGGGAGGVLVATIDLTDGEYPIIIGGGGLGNKGVGYNATPAPGASGTNSTFNGLTALGGAGGGSGHWVPNYRGPTPPVGGSGGGGSPGGIASNPGSAGTAGQGTAGGIGLYISNYFAGAGGGAGGNAEVDGVNNSRPGIGGPGLQSSISGTSLRYGGGGGGAGYRGAGSGNGGLGGGGGGARDDTGAAAATGGTGGVNPGEPGGRATNSAGGAAGANTASGGGGGAHSAGHGGNGGGGIFIIRYAGAPRATGGTITTVGDDTVHTFTTSGTFDLDIPSYQTGINVSTTSAYNGDTIEIVYVDQTAADNTTVAYTITGVASSDIDGESLTGNFTVIGGIAYLTLTATNVTNKTLTLTANNQSVNVSLQYAINMRYLAVAGGGGGGMDMGGGGGAGGLLRSSGQRVASGSYNIVIGAGGTGAPRAGTGAGTQGTTVHQFTIPATKGQDTVFGNLTAFGGGIGGSSYFPYTPGAAGGSGGSGGGASAYSDGSSRSGGAGVAGQGFRGGNGGPSQYYGGGGGGAGGQGVDPNSRADGGPGLEDNILGTSYHWAGGGGGSGYSIQGGNGGIGGGGGGAIGTTTGGAGLNNGAAGGGGGTGVQANTPGGNAGANTGGGGGGGSHYSATNQGGNGGSGIVVVRYSGGQKAVGGTVTTVSTDTVHTFTASGTLTVFPGEGLTPSTASAYFGDTFTVYLTANEPDSTTVPYTISGVTTAEINGASLTGNFTVTGGIASLQIVTVAGTLDTKAFSISAYGYTTIVDLTYTQSFTTPRISSGWGINQVFTLVTRNLSNSTTVPYTITGVDSSDINGASLTGNITITSNQGQLTVSSDPLLLTSKTLTVTIPGGFSLSVALTFITVPAAESLRPMGIEGVSVTSIEVSDLAESTVNAQAWTETFVEEHRFLSSIEGINVIPTDPEDLAEQLTVAVSIGDMPRVDDPTEVRMVGIAASPTYVYTDGAPIAAPDPSETQSIEQWTIT